MNDSSEELAWLRRGTLPPPIVARLHALLARLDARDVTLRSPGPKVPWAERAAALREDLGSGRVFPVDGVVHFREENPIGFQWSFEGPAPPTLCFADDVMRRPLPGTWRLYGLPRSALVIGAEPGANAQHEQPLERYRERLLALQKLDANDLSALRAGRTCALAQATITRAMRLAWLFIGVGLLGGLMGAGSWVTVAMLSPEQTLDIGGLPVAWPAIFMLFPVVFPAIAIHRLFSLRRERSAPIVRLEGIVDRGWAGGRRPQQYVTLAGVYFRGQNEPVLRDLFDALITGSLHRLYVTAHRRLVVGVEPLPAPGPP